MLAAIGIVTKDMERSIAFYSLFGLNFERFGDGEHFEAESNGMKLMIDSFDLMKKLNPDFELPTRSKISICFEQKDSKEVDRVFDSVIKAGFLHTREPWDADWGQRYAIVMDPSGNQVDIYSNLSS